MSLHNLNFDTLCEILKHFVAIDDDGPLTLIMVCTLWRDLVISNHRFWTWITIDDNICELDDRIQIFDALSAGCPLQLTIRLPILDVDRFQHLFGRCTALFIDKCGQSDQLEIEKDVQGICNILKTPLAGSIKRIYWYNGEEPSFFSPISLNEKLEYGTLDLEPFLSAFPAAIVSRIDLKPDIILPGVSYSTLCNALSGFSHLTTLHISVDRLFGNLEKSMTHIFLPLLHSLSLTIPDPSLDPSWSILGYIIAPSIHSVYLTGALMDEHIFIGACQLGKRMRPKKLTLEILGRGYLDQRSLQILNYNLARVQYLTVSLQNYGDDWNVRSRRWENLHFILAGMPYLALFDLRFNDNLECFQELIGPVSCALRVSCRDPFYATKHPSGPLWTSNMSRYKVDDIATDIGPLVKPSRPVEQMSLLINTHELGDIFTHLDFPVSSLKTLIVRAFEHHLDDFYTRPRYQHPGWPKPRQPLILGWLESLQELDIRGVISDHSNIFSNLGNLPNLTRLKCPSWVAIQLINHVHAPQLQKLTIVESDPVTSGIDQWVFEDLMILATTCDIDKRPPLTCIALEFYPEWKTFFEMVTTYSRPRENQPETILRSVELPALPHPSILRPLILALRGEQVAAKDIPSISFNTRRNQGCYFCRWSGWKCIYLKENYCIRHTPYNLVAITAETLRGVSGQSLSEGNA